MLLECKIVKSNSEEVIAISQCDVLGVVKLIEDTIVKNFSNADGKGLTCTIDVALNDDKSEDCKDDKSGDYYMGTDYENELNTGSDIKDTKIDAIITDVLSDKDEDDGLGYIDVENNEDVTEIDIQQRCEELLIEYSDLPDDELMCIVGDSTVFLMNGINCNLYRFRLFGRYLITNPGIDVIDTCVDVDMTNINDTVLECKVDDIFIRATVEQLEQLGLVTWYVIDDCLNMTGLELRSITTICKKNEVIHLTEK